MHLEQHPQLDNLIAMQNLRTSANKESNDAYDVSISLTRIRDQNPSLGYIFPGEPRQRSPNAPKFEDRSLEETEWPEQGAREAAWRLAKVYLN